MEGDRERERMVGVISEIGWEILGTLDEDCLTPLEEIVMGLGQKGYSVAPDDFLGETLALFRASFVVIMQEPVPGFGQSFPSHVVLPLSPRDILGDVAGGFEEFCAAGDYARKEKACARMKPAGVPFGIYLSLTGEGRRRRDER